MPSLPRYHPLQQGLAFSCSVRLEHRIGNAVKELQLRYPLTFQPAPKQGWGSYCLAITRGPSECIGYTPNAADEVVAQLSTALYYLEITLDEAGHALKLRNHAAIWQRWRTEIVPAVTSAYSGAWVEKIIAKMEVQLLHADSLLQTILGYDYLLHPYLSVVEWLAGGTDVPAPFWIGGGALQLRDYWDFSTLPNGIPALEIRSAGSARKVHANPKMLFPKGAGNTEGNEDFTVNKELDYEFLPNSLWPSALRGHYKFDGNAAFEKNIYLRATLL